MPIPSFDEHKASLNYEQVKKMVKEALQELQNDEKKQKEFEELKKTVQKTSQTVEQFCSLHPDSPLCKTIAKTVREELEKSVPKLKTKDEVSKKDKDYGIALVPKLPPISKQLRKMMSPEEEERRTQKVLEAAKRVNMTLVDMMRAIESDPISKKNLPAYVIKRASTEELIQALLTCKGDECRLISMELEKRRKAMGKEKEEKEKPHI